MKKYLSVLCVSVVLGAGPAIAQTPPAPSATPAQPPAPLSFVTSLKARFDNIKTNLVLSAEKMPEEQYGFKPVPEVRSFGEIIGHVIDANYLFCSRVRGEANPVAGKSFEKVTAKADLVKAIKDAVAYCDPAYASATDANILAMIKIPAANNTTLETARANPLTNNVAHNNEHYGNLVTYMRIKGLVPPSSEPRPAAR